MGIESMLMGKYKQQIDKGSELGKKLLFDEIEAEKEFIFLTKFMMDKTDGEERDHWRTVSNAHIRVYNDLIDIKDELNLGE